MHVVGNPLRSHLHHDPLPDGPLTDRQRTIADAIRGCLTLGDTVSVPKETTTTITVCTVRYGTPEADVLGIVQQGIERAEKELARLKALLHAYGTLPFEPRPEFDHAPRGDFKTRHEVLVAIMQSQSRQGRTMIQAGSRKVIKDASGAYILAPEKAQTPSD